MTPTLDPIFDSYGVVALLVSALLAILFVGPAYGGLTVSRRFVLLAMRISVILLAGVAMLRPGCIRYTSRQESAVLAIAVDVTRSMTLPETPGEPATRYEAEQQALRNVAPLIEELQKNVEVEVFAYDSQVTSLPIEAGEVSFPAEPNGEQTDLAAAVYETLLRQRGKRLLGLIVLGDGAQTAFNSPIELPAVQRELHDLQAPLYAVGFGPIGDDAVSEDVSVVSFPDQRDVFVKNEMLIQGAIRVRHFVNKEIPVSLIIEKDDRVISTLGPEMIVAGEKDETIDVAFRYSPQEPGQYKLTLKAADQRGELVTRNNELSAYLTVLEGGLKVLFLTGELRWEGNFLRRSLDASQDIELDFQWIDKRRRDTWPVDIRRELAGDEYDVIILGDLDSAALYANGAADSSMRSLATAVSKGKGLITLGGYNAYGPGGYGNSPLAALLPITFGDRERQPVGQPITTFDLHHEGPLVMLPTGDHYLTMLGPDADNESIWRSLPPLTGANKFKTVKPTARVLAESEEGIPLLVASEYGQGRVLAFAGDSSWQWWMRGSRDAHRRFWRQVVLWLARREGVENDDVWIKLRQRRFNPGSEMTFVAGARTGLNQPVTDADWNVQVTQPDGSIKTANMTLQGEEYQGKFPIGDLPGTYSISISAAQQGRSLGEASAQFMVFDHDVELSNPAAEHDRLKRLTAATEEAGGKFLQPHELADALREIMARPLETESLVKEKWRLGDTWWDAWLAFLAFATLLIGEWALRKKWGLI